MPSQLQHYYSLCESRAGTPRLVGSLLLARGLAARFSDPKLKPATPPTMAIQVTCMSCGARFAVEDKYAGREGPCPKCKAVIRVPAAGSEPTRSRRRSSSSAPSNEPASAKDSTSSRPASSSKFPPVMTKAEAAATTETSPKTDPTKKTESTRKVEPAKKPDPPRKPEKTKKLEADSPAARAAAKQTGETTLASLLRKPSSSEQPAYTPSDPTADDDVVIHAPDMDDRAVTRGQAAKGGTRVSTKPIARVDPEFNVTRGVFGVVAVIAVFAVAWFLGQALEAAALAWSVWGLTFAISIPLAWSTYWMLSDPELERHEGSSLWLRAAICGSIYSAIWVAWMLIPGEYTETGLGIAIMAAPSVVVGLIAAFATLDLEWESSAVHFVIFAGLSLLLRAAAGLPWV